jgi:demethylmenaquinone methyltransferase/2-methoxy-6-polyprenyl-1,4-benzoquinol methylase
MKPSTPVVPYENMSLNKKGQIALMFNNIASSYDRLNHLLSLGIDRYWRWYGIRQLKDLRPQIVLDVATGTADLAIAAARQLKPSLIVGTDISEQMLVHGREKIKHLQLDKIITLQLGDAENLGFHDNKFDAITVAFGVRNFENLHKGVSELFRVLRPKGRLMILEFSKPQLPIVKQVYQFYFTHILPRVGKLISNDSSAYTYLPESVQAFPEREAFVKILLQYGFKTATCIPLTFGICSVYIADK